MRQLKIWFENFLSNQNVAEAAIPYLSFLTMLLITVVLLILGVYLTKVVLRKTIGDFVSRTNRKWQQHLIKYKLLNALSLVVAIIILKATLPLLFEGVPELLIFMEKLLDIFQLIVVFRIINSILKATEESLLSTQLYIDKPISSYFQLIRIALVVLGIVLSLSILLSKSPLYFFGAFGAISAVLLLIFKDTLLGLVASVQISANDMVRIGDWVEMPKFNADGDVVSINLNTVKVKNWDKTITTVPTYYFVTEGFKNWRGMQDSGGRRIKRTLRVSLNSVRFVDEELRDRLMQYDLLKEYLTEREQEIQEHNKAKNVNTAVLINGRRLTNIGVFRVYIKKYLEQHPEIHQEMLMSVRQMNSDEFGVPIEVYCFANTTKFVKYEEIQSDVFDHLFAAATFFDIELFQRPTGKELTMINKK